MAVKVGDLVTLAEGDGTLMKVEKIGERTLALCEWHDGEELMRRWHLPEKLLVVLAKE